jgi:hypothetical protein
MQQLPAPSAPRAGASPQRALTESRFSRVMKLLVRGSGLSCLTTCTSQSIGTPAVVRIRDTALQISGPTPSPGKSVALSGVTPPAAAAAKPRAPRRVALARRCMACRQADAPAGSAGATGSGAGAARLRRWLGRKARRECNF